MGHHPLTTTNQQEAEGLQSHEASAGPTAANLADSRPNYLKPIALC